MVGGEIIGEAKRKVLADIENHKQEHKRWVNVWRNAHRTCTYIVQLLYYNNVTLHHCVTVVCGKVSEITPQICKIGTLQDFEKIAFYCLKWPKKWPKWVNNSHEGVYCLNMASSSLFVFINVHTGGSKWDLRCSAVHVKV